MTDITKTLNEELSVWELTCSDCGPISRMQDPPRTSRDAERAAADHAEWHRRREEGAKADALLSALPAGAEFRLSIDQAGRSYRALYRKNADGLWDQVPGTCEAPHIYNISAHFLGFVNGVDVIREALAREAVQA